MKKQLATMYRALLCTALCVTLTGFVFVSVSAAAAAETQEQVQKKLNVFLQEYAESINRCALRNVQKNADGSWTASYTGIDPKSFSATFAPPKSTNPPKGLKYMATVNYHAVTYNCTAPSKAAALKGPFVAAGSMPTTEWIKYLNGKWTN